MQDTIKNMKNYNIMIDLIEMAGLKDMNQLITYQYEADSMDRQWYSIL